MTRYEYIERMKTHHKKFETIWQEIVTDTLKYKKDNPEITMYDHNDVEHIADDFAMLCAWLYDTINGLKLRIEQ